MSSARSSPGFFSIGACVEQLACGRLLLANGPEEVVAEVVTHEGRTYAPHPLDPELERSLRLPSVVAPREPGEAVIADLAAVLRGPADLGPVGRELAVAFCLASWFADLLPGAPVLNLHGVDGLTSSTPSVIAALSRRPLPLASLDLAELLRLPPDLTPTIVVHHARRRELLQLLALADRPEAGVLHHGKLVHFRCSVLAISDEPLDLPCGVSWPSVTADQEPTMPLDPVELDRLAAELGPRLLRYRVDHHREVASATCNVVELSPRARRVAHVLGPAFAPVPERQQELIAALRQYDADAKADLARSATAHVLTALVTLCGERKKEALVGEVAELANALRHAEGEHDLSPKTVGLLLKRLGLPRKRRADGYIVVLDKAAVEVVRACAQSYGVQAAPGDDSVVHDVHEHHPPARADQPTAAGEGVRA